MNNTAKIESMIQNSKVLPSIPQVLLKLIDACNNEDTTASTLSDIVSKDPSIAARVMQMVNSSYTGLSERINTLDEGVRYLGGDTIKNISIAASVLQVFGKEKRIPGFTMPFFWYHSLLCALLAKKIAKQVAYPPEEAFLAGLFHDMGKLMLAVNFSSQVDMGDDEDHLIGVIEEKLDLTHAQVGAVMAGQWGIKQLVCDSILYHHEDIESIADTFLPVKVVYVANALCAEGTSLDVQRFSSLCSLLDLDPIVLKTDIADAIAEIQTVSASFGIKVTKPGENRFQFEQKASQQALAGEVETYGLMYGTLQSILSSETMAEILINLERGLKLLFEPSGVILFIHNPDKDILEGMGTVLSGSEQPSLSVGSASSIISRSFREKRICTFWTGEYEEVFAIADKQITGLLKGDGIIAVPMVARNDGIGVIVMGVSALNRDRLKGHVKRITLFAQQAAICLQVDMKKEKQHKLISDQRIEASIITARKVVHEVNNPLGIITNYLKILSLKLPEKHSAQDELGVVQKEISRVSSIIRKLSVFSTPGIGIDEPFDVNDLIRDISGIIETALFAPRRIKLNLDLTDDELSMTNGENNLKQIMMNLLKNAAEALGHDGNVYVQTRYVCSVSLEKKSPRNHIEIIVKDDGPGVSGKIGKKIFEPFNSSKNGDHSGLGLAIVHSRVRDMGGEILFESKNGLGTTFTMAFPVQ